MSETKVFIPPASVNLPIVAETFDDADVRPVRYLPVGEGTECETVVEFRGVTFQTWLTTPAEFAAGLRRLADRVEAAHEES